MAATYSLNSRLWACQRNEVEMRTPPPACPRCQEFDLYVRQEGDVVTVRCAECGWTTGRITLATGQDAGEVVAATVEAAKEEAK